MPWEHLFDDLESQLEQEFGAEEVDLLAEEERLRLGRLAVRDRVRAMTAPVGDRRPLRLLLVDRSRLALTVEVVGRDWLAGEADAPGGRRSCVVPLASVAACFPDAAQLHASTAGSVDDASAAGTLTARLGLTFVLRDLCRRRVSLDVTTPGGLIHGTLDRVARDHVDLAEHEPGSPRRERDVRIVRMLPIAQIVLVRF